MNLGPLADLAFHPDPAAVTGDRQPAERQAHAQAAWGFPARSSRTYFSKMCSCSANGMPGPLSCTHICTQPRSVFRPTLIWPPGGVNLRGILQQVDQHPADHIPVHPDRRQLAGQVAGQRLVPAFSHRVDGFDGVCHQRDGFYHLLRKDGLAGFQAVDIQQ